MIIPANFAQVRHLFSGPTGGRRAMVQYGIGVAGVADPDDIVESLHTSVGDVVEAICNTSSGLQTTQVQFGPNPTGPTAEYSEYIQGTVGGSPLSPQVAILVKKQTLLGGREGRGRLYFPFTSEAIVDGDGGVDGGALATIQAAVDAWHESLITSILPMFLLHNSATAPTAVKSLEAEAKVATQRKRLVRS